LVATALVVFVGPAHARATSTPVANAPRASARTAASTKSPPSTRSRSCANANLVPTATNAKAIAAATLCLIDHVRAAYRLGPVHANSELQGVATAQVNDMVSRNYFADNRPPAQTPAALIEATHYPAHSARLSTGQNIGWGTGPYATPAQMVAAWMASPPHREIMLLREYREAGVGVAAAVPSVLGQALPGATYAIEFAVRG
jgi:uncharacterized protein YkwD